VARSSHDEKDLESSLVNAETLEKGLERPVNQNAQVYAGLSTVYYRLFQLTRLEGYLPPAISNGWAGYKKSTKEDPTRAAIAGNLSSTLLASYDCGGETSIAHLEQSLTLAKEAFALSDADDVYRNIYILNVVKGLVGRSSQPGHSLDLDDAISRGEDLLLNGKSYPKWPQFAVNLCDALNTRHEWKQLQYHRGFGRFGQSHRDCSKHHETGKRLSRSISAGSLVTEQPSSKMACG
jgi:hypothetical protein